MLLWLLQNTVLAALLAVGVAVFCRLARPNPAVRHILWLVVLARLLMPPGLHWPWSLPDPLEAKPPAVAAVVLPEPVVEPTAPPVGAETETFLATVEPSEPEETPAAAAPVPVGPPQWPLWLARSALA